MFTIKKSDIYILFLFFILNLYFILRWNQFNLETAEILPFIIGYNLILILNIIAYYFFKDYINPISAYSFFLFCFLYSFIPLSGTQKEYSDYGILIIGLTIASFLTGVIVFTKIRLFNIFPVFTHRSKKIIFFSIFFLSIFAFIFEIFKIGYLPIFNVFNKSVYGDYINAYTPLLNTFLLISYVIPVWSLLLFKKNIISRTTLILVLFVSIFIIINHFGRQMFLVLGLSAIAYIQYIKIISYKKLLALAVAGILLFFVIGFIRSGSLSAVERENEIIKRSGSIDQNTNLLESYLVFYSSVRFGVFEEMLQEKQKQKFFGMGAYTLRPLFKITNLSDLSYFKKPEFDSYNKLGTYAIEPLLDAGILGVLIINFFYGYIITYIFVKYSTRSGLEYIIPWSILLFCAIMMPFTNTFNTFFTWIVLLFNKFLFKT